MHKNHFEAISQQNILVVGDFMLDKYLYGDVTRVSPEAPVPVAHIRKTDIKLGGAGNVAINIAALNANVKVLSCIGNDANGDKLVGMLENLGVDTEFIYKDSAWSTIVKTRVVSQNQQLLRYDEEDVQAIGANTIQKIRNSVSEIIGSVTGIILSDYGKGFVTEEIAQLIIQEAKAKGIPVAVDPKGSDYTKYRGATVCTPNMKELTEATGGKALRTDEEIYEAALLLSQKCDLNYILATRSEKGMSLIDKDGRKKLDFPAVAQEVSDVTGAGDTVISLFTLGMAAGYSKDVCCKIANAAAAIVVSKFGAATVSMDELVRATVEEICLDNKKVNFNDIERIAESIRHTGKRIVFTNGCFDILHAGHISSFRQAREFGDFLIMGVNSDDSIRRIKGPQRPIVSQDNRVALLEAIDCIDCIVVFDEDTPQKLIERIKPDCMVKGKDWEGKPVAGMEFVQSYGGKVCFIELEQGLSTTAIIEKIIDVYGDGK